MKYPLAAPSANISTNISAVSKEDVKDEFGNKIKYILIFSFLLSSFSRVIAQPKLSIDLGLGLYQPSLDGFDDNTAFPAKAFLNRNLLLNYGVYYEFFSNARIGRHDVDDFGK